mmetsp:Transcript_15494/g.27194  ORF Transcript_15494/g.27194 Transcript_15494/m.27194 type:complete len:252 (+) Transcript_15494:314-1069(+)
MILTIAQRHIICDNARNPSVLEHLECVFVGDVIANVYRHNSLIVHIERIEEPFHCFTLIPVQPWPDFKHAFAMRFSQRWKPLEHFIHTSFNLRHLALVAHAPMHRKSEPIILNPHSLHIAHQLVNISTSTLQFRQKLLRDRMLHKRVSWPTNIKTVRSRVKQLVEFYKRFDFLPGPSGHDSHLVLSCELLQCIACLCRDIRGIWVFDDGCQGAIIIKEPYRRGIPKPGSDFGQGIERIRNVVESMRCRYPA